MLSWLRSWWATHRPPLPPAFIPGAPAPDPLPTPMQRAVERWQDELTATLAALEAEAALYRRQHPPDPPDPQDQRTTRTGEQ